MKKTIKLSEQDLNRIVKQVINEQKNVLFPSGSDNAKAKPGWERRRYEKGGKMAGEMYNDIMNEIEELSNFRATTEELYDHAKRMKNLYDKIVYKTDLPYNKKEQLRTEIVSLWRNQIQELQQELQSALNFFKSL